MSRVGKSMEAESRLAVARGWRDQEATANRPKVPSRVREMFQNS